MESLFKLVNSLHQSEKRYVNLKLQSSKSNSLLHKYFEAVCSLKKYDFDVIKKQFPRTSEKILKNSLRNLYLVVLSHVRAYMAKNSDENQMANMLKEVKILIDRSLFKEAERLNKKLLSLSESLEYFFYQKEGLNNKWNLLHLQGELNRDVTFEVNEQLSLLDKKEEELNKENKLYREMTTMYYHYFFYERTDKTKAHILSTVDGKLTSSPENLLSAKAKMTWYEIQSMRSLVAGDLLAHHQVRKDQLKLLLNSPVFENDFLSKILVFSNVLTYLKYKNAIPTLIQYLEFFAKAFYPVIIKNNDSVLLEKYYDIYFQNQIFIQNWLRDKNAINNLIEEFKEASKREFKKNVLLVSRMYLSFSQLLIFSGSYKLALQHLIEFQAISLDKKKSTNFIDSELHLLMVYYLMEKQDVYDRQVETLRRKSRVEIIHFNEDQQLLFDAFYKVYKEGSYDNKYTGNKPWLKIYLEVLSGKTMEQTVNTHFSQNKFIELQEDVSFLAAINK